MHSDSDLADRLIRKRQETDFKIKLQKEQQAKEELVGCTFQPQLINNHLYPQVHPQVMNLAGMASAAYH